MRSPRLGVLGLRPADLLAAARGGRPRPRLTVVAFASAAAAEVVLLAGGVLPTRVSTRSAVSRSVSRVATVARSVSRRASRSLIFVFSALIWSNIVGVVVGMVAFSGVKSIRMINLLASSTPTRDIQPQNALIDLVGGRRELGLCPKSRTPRASSFCWIGGHRKQRGYWQCPVIVKPRRPGMTEVGPLLPEQRSQLPTFGR